MFWGKMVKNIVESIVILRTAKNILVTYETYLFTLNSDEVHIQGNPIQSALTTLKEVKVHNILSIVRLG